MKKIALPDGCSYWVLLCIAPLPLLYFLFHYAMTIERIKELDEKMETVYTRKKQSEQVERRQHSVISSVSQSDLLYIDKHLESLIFLESDIKKMENLCAETHGDEMTQKRLHFLKDGSNQLLFAEEKIRSKDKVREIFERQKHPVETSEEDLKKLLCLIEGVTIWPYGPKEGRPQLIVQDFQLSKKRYSPKDHVFILNMNIIKRESNAIKD